MNFMKSALRLTFLFALVSLVATVQAQEEDKSKRKSPPMEAVGQVDGIEVKVNYGAPSVRDREIFGALVPYDKVDRFGANEATTIEVSGDIMFGDQKLAAGKYSMFLLPKENEDWQLIVNTVSDQWGAYEYDESKDVFRVAVKPHKLDENVEQMKIAIKEKEGKSYLYYKWADTKLAVPLSGAGDAN